MISRRQFIQRVGLLGGVLLTPLGRLARRYSQEPAEEEPQPEGELYAGFVLLPEEKVRDTIDETSDTISTFLLFDHSKSGNLATVYGYPLFIVTADNDEWEVCQRLAEDVLATLHIP